jgi:[CysO sulfur-carrier protein]-S-L-cysteine hydrolase
LVESIQLAENLINQIFNHVQRVLPEEACGLVAGKNSVGVEVIAVTNEVHSPVRYRMAPQEQLEAFLWLENQELELLALYHSHPGGPAFPSATDIAEYAYPDSVMIVCYPADGEWHAGAFLIKGNTYQEVVLNKENTK